MDKTNQPDIEPNNPPGKTLIVARTAIVASDDTPPYYAADARPMSYVLICPACKQVNTTDFLVCSGCATSLADVDTDHLNGLAVRPTDSELLAAQIASGTFIKAVQPLSLEIDGSVLMMPSQASVVVGRHHAGPSAVKLDVDLSFFQAASKGVSRCHLQIERRAMLVFVKDLQSRNGTWLNGRRLLGDGERLVRNGDELRLGQLVIRLRFVQTASLARRLATALSHSSEK